MDKKTFSNIDDELNWWAVVMSEGNFEAVGEFVRLRNLERENLPKKTQGRELNV